MTEKTAAVKITGILTDYAVMDEGKFAGRYGARIDDKPYPVLAHVDAVLVTINKGENVDVTLTEDGAITRIARSKKTSPAKKTLEGDPPKCVMGDCPDNGNHFLHHRQRNRWECGLCGIDNPNLTSCPLVKQSQPSSSTAVAEKARKAGFGTPTEGPIANPAKTGIEPTMAGNPIRTKDGIFICPDCDCDRFLETKSMHYECQGCKKTWSVTQVNAIIKNGGKVPNQKLTSDVPPAKERGQVRSITPVESPKDTTPPTGQPDGIASADPAAQTAVIVRQDPAPVPIHAKSWSDEEILLIRNMVARGCSEPEFKLLMYLARTYGLDPLAKQIWAVKRNDNSPALIFAGRDGFLALAHRSGQFDGMDSGVKYDGDGKDRKPVSAWCEIWRKDMSHSFKTEVPFSEYNTGYTVWKSNPSAMILKVAESVCLRKAFCVSGLYSPEEIDTSSTGR